MLYACIRWRYAHGYIKGFSLCQVQRTVGQGNAFHALCHNRYAAGGAGAAVGAGGGYGDIPCAVRGYIAVCIHRGNGRVIRRPCNGFVYGMGKSRYALDLAHHHICLFGAYGYAQSHILICNRYIGKLGGIAYICRGKLAVFAADLRGHTQHYAVVGRAGLPRLICACYIKIIPPRSLYGEGAYLSGGVHEHIRGVLPCDGGGIPADR